MSKKVFADQYHVTTIWAQIFSVYLKLQLTRYWFLIVSQAQGRLFIFLSLLVLLLLLSSSSSLLLLIVELC